MKQQRKWYYLLWFSFIVEAGSLTFLKDMTGKYSSPVLFILGAIGVLYAALKLLRATPLPVLTARLPVKQKEIYIIGYIIIFGVLGFLGWLWLQSVYNDYPIDPRHSDIIPLIKKMNQRYMGAGEVYDPITDFGYTIYPNYLPATWMPFIVAEKWGLDYRTWAYILLSSVLFLYGWFFARSDKKLLFMLLSFAVLALFLWYQPSAFGWTVEPMVAGFYLLLVLGIYLQRLWLIGLALLLCLLSRYAVVLWVPVILLLLFFYHSKKRTIYTILFIAVGIFFFLFIHIVETPGFLQKGYDYYTTGTLAEWKGQAWQQPDDLPFQLSQGYGFAIYFYKWGKGGLLQKIHLLQIIHFAICGIISLIAILWYWLKGRKWLPLKWALLLSLHLYMVFFFAFIQLPYAYLFLTPLLVSMMVVLLVSFTAYPMFKITGKN